MSAPEPTTTKLYRGQPPQDVTVWQDGDSRPLEHHVAHSPGGFGWGYGGSAPADLALALLWDVLGEEPHPGCVQAFKAEVVAGWPQRSRWSIDEAEIAGWLDAWRAGGDMRWVTVSDYQRWLDEGESGEAAAT